MTEEQLLERIREALEANGGHIRAACQAVARELADDAEDAVAFTRRFGDLALERIEHKGRRGQRAGMEDEETSWTPPEGWEKDGRSEAIERTGALNRVLAIDGRRVRLADVTAHDLRKHGQMMVRRGRKQVANGETFVEIAEAMGEGTLADHIDDLDDVQVAFLVRRSDEVEVPA